MNIL
jgi:GR25 family glycosyltransferase involved in LPS biosynthesis